MYPHRIRLRGPWECEPLTVRPPYTGPLPPPRRMTLPARWSEAGLPGFAGRVRFRRRFGYPGRIDPHERVWLTCAGCDGQAETWLNGTPLGPLALSASAFEVTALLRPRNELVVEMEGGPEGGLWGEVALEVRCTAFLRAVCSALVPVGDRLDLHVRGEAVGTAERPLDLYAVLGRSPVAYALVEPTPAGRSFLLSAEGVSVTAGEEPAVRVDLVNGATVWYTIEQWPARAPAADPEA